MARVKHRARLEPQPARHTRLDRSLARWRVPGDSDATCGNAAPARPASRGVGRGPPETRHAWGAPVAPEARETRPGPQRVPCGHQGRDERLPQGQSDGTPWHAAADPRSWGRPAHGGEGIEDRSGEVANVREGLFYDGVVYCMAHTRLFYGDSKLETCYENESGEGSAASSRPSTVTLNPRASS
jgi:hypothetical protein